MAYRKVRAGKRLGPVFHVNSLYSVQRHHQDRIQKISFLLTPGEGQYCFRPTKCLFEVTVGQRLDIMSHDVFQLHELVDTTILRVDGFDQLRGRRTVQNEGHERHVSFLCLQPLGYHRCAEGSKWNLSGNLGLQLETHEEMRRIRRRRTPARERVGRLGLSLRHLSSGFPFFNYHVDLADGAGRKSGKQFHFAFLVLHPGGWPAWQDQPSLSACQLGGGGMKGP